MASLDLTLEECEAQNLSHGDTGIGAAADDQPLDDVLNFVVKFLEGEHPKSSSMSPGTRAMVFNMVKQTLAWKQTARKQDEVHAKILEINRIMSTVVAGLS